MISCTICGAPHAPVKDKTLAETACACGAVGNFQVSTSTAERLEMALRDRVKEALAAGVSQKDAVGVLSKIALEVEG